MIEGFYNSDCMDVMKSMEDGSVDFTLTDIPYDFAERTRNRKDPIRDISYGAANVITFDLVEFLSEVHRVTKNGGLIFCGWNQFSDVGKFFFEKDDSIVRPIVWVKDNPNPMNGKVTYLKATEFAVWFKFNGVNAPFHAEFKHNVFNYPVQHGTDKIRSHPTKKNLDMFKDIILDNTDPGQVVFDPCCGSGTTIEACLLTNRKFKACELDPKYYSEAELYLESNYGMLLAMN